MGVLLWLWPPVKLFRQQEWGLSPGLQHRVFSPCFLPCFQLQGDKGSKK